MKWTDKIKKAFGSDRIFTEIPTDEENAALLAAIGYGERSLLVTGDDGNLYQIIDGGEGYLFANVNHEHYITEFDEIPDEVFRRRSNFVVSKSSITSVDIGVDYGDKAQTLVEYAEIKLRWAVRVKGNKSYQKQKHSFSFDLAEQIAAEKLRAFFEGAGEVRLMTCEEYDDTVFPKLSREEVNTRKALYAALIALPVVSVLSMLAAFFTHGGVQKGFLTVCALLPFVLFALYLTFHRYLAFDKGYMEQNRLETCLSFCIMILVDLLLMFYGDSRLYAVPIEHLGKWAVLSLVPTALLTVLLLAFSSDIKRRDSKSGRDSAELFVIFALAASVCAVYLLNYTCDFGRPKVYTAEITGKSTEANRSVEDYYHYVDTVYPFEVHDSFRVTAKVYEMAEIGDSVTVESHSGGLGMAYKTIAF